jgi:P27 family predicted phage terminase small subunit
MGKRGPAARPTALKKLAGEKTSRINDAEPEPATGAVSPPDWLSAEARAVWDELAPDLIAKKVLTSWDVEPFGVLCDAVTHYRQASAAVAEQGVLVPGRKDAVVKNPAMQLVRDTAATIRAYCGEFGLTPSSRSGVSIAEEDTDGTSAARLLT